MATFTYADDDLVQCPYNPNHRVKRTRIDNHLSKCKKMVGQPCLRPCLFNATHLMPAMGSLFLRHLETCPDRSSTLPMRREDVDRPYVVPVAGASLPLPEPEEMWEAGTPATYKPQEPAVTPVFRQVHGMTRAERRLYYQSLFPNSSPEGYAPLKQPKAQNSILSSSQPTIAVHAQAETRQPHGAQAQDDHPQVVHAVQGNQRLGGQASPTPAYTGADPYPNTTDAKRSVDVNEFVKRLKALGRASQNRN
nr:gametocyte-specific factor 1 homolog [Rhipicephalus microplus]